MAAPPHPISSPEQNQNQFVSVPTTPMVQPQPYYETQVLHPHSPYSINIENYNFWLQQCWRIRFGLRLVILLSSMGVVAAAAYIMNNYNDTKRNTGGLWRDKAGQGGIDMSPVVLLLAVGAVIIAFSFIMILGSLIPAINHINKLSDIISLSLSSISLIGSIAAVTYSFQHPSMNVDFDSPSPISLRKYACTLSPQLLQSAQQKTTTGEPMGGVDGRVVVLFSSMCGQFNLAWVLALVVMVFEIMVLISIPLGRKWRKGLEEVERAEDELIMREKYRRL
ncbi:hypothetical protein BGX38DRAFT_1260108 [Terfezia claveryi]|nr:hypothetical protein BGX38DRAFT_1260108 [Terfezia claveryi]